MTRVREIGSGGATHGKRVRGTATIVMLGRRPHVQAGGGPCPDQTEDNPNVWYELGYAFAVDTPVVMTCADQRTTKLPFDIQHRTVIRYATASPSDFERLRDDITKRVAARIRRAESIQQLAEEQVAPQEGASPVEVMVLGAAAANMAPGFSALMDHVQKDAERAGLTRTGFHVAVRRLVRKHFITIEDVTRENLDGE